MKNKRIAQTLSTKQDPSTVNRDPGEVAVMVSKDPGEVGVELTSSIMKRAKT